MLRNINLIKRLIMNEIQKFKKNRMIPKGQYGLKSHEILGATVNGENVAYVNIPGKGYIAIDGMMHLNLILLQLQIKRQKLEIGL